MNNSLPIYSKKGESSMVGITERGDAGLDLSWVDKLDSVRFAVLITKNVNDEFIYEALDKKDKLIIHCTITGLGGTEYEPNVPNMMDSYYKIIKLIKLGFNPDQLVLRVDPIICNLKGYEALDSVLKVFSVSGIKRVRYSFLDMYPHVKRRFLDSGILLPYTSFNPPLDKIKFAYDIIKPYRSVYQFESCAETYEESDRIGCISKKDYDILGIPFVGGIKSNQRKLCLCVNKKELLSNRRRCAHQCIYCYWK